MEAVALTEEQLRSSSRIRFSKDFRPNINMMKDKPSLIGSSGDSMRESFGKEITKLAKIKRM